jgi:alpha-galactosidase/6-phospho-beta-glucosidase family protein
MKLAVIGAGSTYTPELVSGLMRERERLGVRDLVLHDIDASRSGSSSARVSRARWSSRASSIVRFTAPTQF